MKKARKAKRGESFYFDTQQIADLFLRQEFLRSANALAVADSVFEVEKAFRTGSIIRKANIPLFRSGAFGYDLGALKKLLHDLIVYVLTEDISITLSVAKTVKEPHKKPSVVKAASTVCLFSGGLDSYAGILLAQAQLKNVVGVFAAHADQGRIIHIVRKLEKRILAGRDILLHELRVPSVGAQGYAQLRGFLYMVGAAAWMNILGADRLLVTECGPTMYQPRFSPFDAITMTTHPVVVHFAARVITAILQRNVDIVTPFENLTKAEVFAISPDKAGLRLTHSCISQRFGRHDGTCYGCVVRRLAGIAAGVNDVHYDRNPISDRYAYSGNLMSLLAFSHDLLTDYSNMDSFEVEIIEAYSKRDLFYRFALDNFAAIHRLLQEGRRVRPSVVRLYDSVAEEIGRKRLSARLDELQEAKFVAAFR